MAWFIVNVTPTIFLCGMIYQLWLHWESRFASVKSVRKDSEEDYQIHYELFQTLCERELRVMFHYQSTVLINDEPNMSEGSRRKNTNHTSPAELNAEQWLHPLEPDQLRFSARSTLLPTALVCVMPALTQSRSTSFLLFVAWLSSKIFLSYRLPFFWDDGG